MNILRKGIPPLLIALTVMFPLGAQNIENGSRKIQPLPVELADEPAVIVGGVRFTIGDAIRGAIEKNHTILSGAYDVAMTDTQYQAFQKKYATFLSGSMGLAYSEYPPSMSLLNGENQKTVDMAVGVTRSFSTGTTVSAGVQHSYASSKLSPVAQQFGMLDSSHSPVVFVSIQQELLKNAFGKNDSQTEKILKNATRMQREAILYQLSLVVVSVIMDYWNVIISQTALDNARLQLQETQYVRDITARNVELGLVDNYNLNYYNALVAGAKSQVTSCEKTYRDCMRDFLRTMNLDEDSTIPSTTVLTDRLPEIDEQEALKQAFAKRSDYRNAVLAVENARMNNTIASNETLPSVIAEINANTLAQDSFGRAYGDTFTLAYPTIEGRVSVVYPLDDTDAKANRRNASYQLRQAELALDRTRREVRDDIASKIDQIRSLHDLYINARDARKQSELFYTRMLTNMRRGRLTASTVKNGLDALVESRQSELQALVYYNVALLQFDVAKNELWERYGIDVDKYIPKEDR